MAVDMTDPRIKDVPELANWGKAVVICLETGERYETTTSHIGILSDFDGDFPAAKEIYVTDYIWTCEVETKSDWLIWKRINDNQDIIGDLMEQASQYMTDDEQDEICSAFHSLPLLEMQSGLIAAYSVLLNRLRNH